MTDVEEFEPDFETRSRPTRRWRERGALLGGLVVLLAVLGTLFAFAGDDPPESAEAEIVDPLPDDVDPVVLQPGGPYDGLESIGLPVVADPDVGLIDGQRIIVRGEGFDPGATVAVVQCWLPETGGSQDDCDLGNLVITSSDSQGLVEANFPVRRYIGTASGAVDCSLGGITETCRVAIGNVENYDQSGSSRIWLDPEVDGDEPPQLSVTPATGLFDGETITIVGEGFVPDEIALVTQCLIGGMNGVSGCFGSNPVAEVLVDGQGGFAATLDARRIVLGVGGDHDCFSDVYPCMLVVGARRNPNPVRLVFDGSIRPPQEIEYTLSPSESLVEGDAIHLEVFDLPVAGTLTIAQCVDQGPLGETCDPRADATAADGRLSADLVVSRILVNEVGDEVDCAQSGRTCYLRLLHDELADVRIPVRFAVAG